MSQQSGKRDSNPQSPEWESGALPLGHCRIAVQHSVPHHFTPCKSSYTKFPCSTQKKGKARPTPHPKIAFVQRILPQSHTLESPLSVANSRSDNRMKNVRYSNCSEHSGSSLQSRARLTSPSTSSDTVGNGAPLVPLFLLTSSRSKARL